MKQFNTSILKVRGSDGQFKELPAIAGTIADDTKISTETTWSSEKLVSRFASKPQKIADSLYLVEYSGLNPDAAEDYFTRFQPIIGGACSSMHNGNFYGRNYDWSRNHQAVFVVHVPSIGAKHASYGMAAMTSLTTDIADTGVYDNRYEILPFITLDGINDAGVVCNTNVVPPNDRGATTGSNPGAPSLCALAVPRFILDNASSAAEAVEMLRARNIYSARYDGLEEEYHFMIGDAENTYIVEFNNNEMVVVEDQHIMTNFFNYGFDGNTATAFYKSEDFDESTTTLTAHPMGLERYDILAATYDTATSVDAMHDAMKSVWYTKTYDADAETPWYSEYCYDYGTESTYGDLDISRPAEDYEGIYNLLCERFATATRDTEGFWETVHSTVYDIEKRQLNVWVKEEDTKYCFSVEKLGQEITTSNSTMGGADWLAADGEAGYIANKPGTSNEIEHVVNFTYAQTDNDVKLRYYISQGQNNDIINYFKQKATIYVDGEPYSELVPYEGEYNGNLLGYTYNISETDWGLIDDTKFGLDIYSYYANYIEVTYRCINAEQASYHPTISFKYTTTEVVPAADWLAPIGASTYIANKPALSFTDPVLTGSLSLNRKQNTTVGYKSVALGDYNEAVASNSITIGNSNEIKENQSYGQAYGWYNELSGESGSYYNQAIGYLNKIKYGSYLTVIGYSNIVEALESNSYTSLNYSVLAGYENTLNNGQYSFLAGYYNKVNTTGQSSFAVGQSCQIYGSGSSGFAAGSYNKIQGSGYGMATFGENNTISNGGHGIMITGNGSFLDATSGAFITGMNNNGIGANYSVICGEQNISNNWSSNSILSGTYNKSYSSSSIITGHYNNLFNSGNIMGGYYNTIYGQYSVISGTGNNAYKDYGATFGYYLNNTYENCLVIGCNNNTIDATLSTSGTYTYVIMSVTSYPGWQSTAPITCTPSIADFTITAISSVEIETPTATTGMKTLTEGTDYTFNNGTITFTGDKNEVGNKNVRIRCSGTHNNVVTLTNDNTSALFMIGNGEDENHRSNAFRVNKDGNAYLNNDLYVGCNADSSGGVKVATEETKNIIEDEVTGKLYKIIVSDGILSAEEIIE